MEDPQRRAFTGASMLDWGEIPFITRLHNPDDPAAPPVKSPEDWDADGWDLDRERPKAIEEAQAALVARVADPAAPDTITSADAYSRGGRA